MLRCVLLAAALCAALPIAAQVQRNFPANALRGELLVVQTPEVLLNGEPARLAPGARIRGVNNMFVVSGALTGQRLIVNYTRERGGPLLDVWILRPAEINKEPWPVNAAQAKAWVFDPVGQTWSQP